MHRATRISILATLALGALALVPLARADRCHDLVLELAFKQQDLTLGGVQPLRVTLQNATDRLVDASELVFDARSVSFHLSGGGVDFYWYVRHRSVLEPIELAVKRLAPGQKLTLEYELPIIIDQELELTAKYLIDPQAKYPETISSPTVKLPRPAKGGTLTARIETSLGHMRMAFLVREAPLTVMNFVDLARRGFYDGLSFHRVIPDFMIQGGCPEGTGEGGPGYSIDGEFRRDLPHRPGVVSMARTDHPDTAGSQFFICTGTPSHLDGSYAAFGRLTEGQEVAKAISKVKTDEANRPVEAVTIKSIKLELGP